MRMDAYVQKTKPTGHKADGGTYRKCPVCNGPNKLEVNKEQTAWYCHKCGVGARLDGSVRAANLGKKPIWYDEDGFDLYRRAGDTLMANEMKEYLMETRGFREQEIATLRPHFGPSAIRAFFPLYTLGSELPVYFIGRLMIEQHTKEERSLPKWSFPKTGSFMLNKSDLLWGLHRISGPVENLVLCEGVFDAVWHPTGVGLMGKVASNAQAELIKKIDPETVTVALDGDAVTEAYQLVEELRQRIATPLYVVEMEPGVDPGDMGVEFETWVEENLNRVA
jgi:hypothetical protein